MKTPEQFLVDLRRRVTKHWHLDLDGPSGIWPHTFALGTVLRSDLETDFAIVQTLTFRWREWTARHQIELPTAVRHVRGPRQAIPSRVTIHSIDTAARLLGQEWVERI